MSRKQLPKSLMFRASPGDVALIRRRMNKICSDQQARIFYDVRDDAQPYPHRAVMLRGREILGWVVHVGTSRLETNERDNLRHVDSQFILPAPALRQLAAERHSSYVVPHPNTYGGETQALLTRTTYEDRDPNAEFDERTDQHWNGEVCSELTRLVGMVEIFETVAHLINFQSKGVLVPLDDVFPDNRRWGLQLRDHAERQALKEVEPIKDWFNLPQREKQLRLPAPADVGTVKFVTRVRQALYRNPEDQAAATFRAAAKFSFRAPWGDGGPMVEVSAGRDLRERLGWAFTVKGVEGASVYHFAAYDDLVDGWEALQFALDACRAGRLPDNHEAPEAAELARADFWRIIKDVREDRRRYRHVLEAMTAGQEAAR